MEVTERDDEFSMLSSESCSENLHIEPVFEAFVCPLTKQVIHDPVTLENGHTFEREAIENYFGGCKENGRKIVCPSTLKELSTTEMIPNIALRHAIEEWDQRNEAGHLNFACRLLLPGNSETSVLRGLSYVQRMSQKSRWHKHVIRAAKVIPMIIKCLRSTNRIVQYESLKTLRILVTDDFVDKEAMAEGDTIRTVIKYLNRDDPEDRQEAVSLLYELSKSETLSEKIGEVNGAILLLVGVASSNSEKILTVQKAEQTLENLELCEKNILQMAQNGRLLPLIRLFLEGSPETQLKMASYLGELALSNDFKISVAGAAGSSLIEFLTNGSSATKKIAIKALNQISSNETSANILAEAGILPPLVNSLLTHGNRDLPLSIKEVYATVLADIVAFGPNVGSIALNSDGQSLVSEEIIHGILQLISNTGPTMERKLLEILVALTASASASTVHSVLHAIKSSGATMNLIHFIEAPQRDLRMASIKLLNNISPHMGQELASALLENVSYLGSLAEIISEDMTISEEQAAAVGFLAGLPEKDPELIRALLHEKVFDVLISQLSRIQHGETRGIRYLKDYMEGLVQILMKLTHGLETCPAGIVFVRDNNLTALFVNLLQTNWGDNVQMVSAMALENLSKQSNRLSRKPPVPSSVIFSSWFRKRSAPVNLCRVHHGICSMKENFCLLEGRALEKLVYCLDHAHEKVVEAALGALCTLLADGVDIRQGLSALADAKGNELVLQVLRKSRTGSLRQKAVWAVERMLRTDGINFEVSTDSSIQAALVDAFRHGDNQTRQIAEQALKHIDRLPEFSVIQKKR